MGGRPVAGAARVFYEEIWRRKVREGPRPEDATAIRETIVAPYIPSGARVLDVGCGTGKLFDLLPSPVRTVGVDVAWSALEVAHRRGHSVIRMDLDSPHLPFRDATFDCVSCLAVVEHLFDPNVLIREAARVLVPGGTLIVLVPNIRQYYRMYQLLVRGRFPRTSGDPEGMDGGHLHYFTFSDVRELIENAGFSAIALTGTGGVRFLASLRSLEILAIARKAG